MADESSPQVGIVIPAWNAQAFIQASVESALSQVDVGQVLVVDDGSTDATSSLVSRHPQYGSRLSLHRQSNQGLAAARNAGLWRLASFPFVWFLDADDVLVDGATTALLAAQRCSGAVAVGGRARYLSADGRTTRGVTRQVAVPLDQAAVLAGRLTPWPPSAALVKTSAALSVGGFDADLGRYAGFPEDLDFWARLGRLGPLELVDVVVLLYRVHEQSISALRAQELMQGERYVQYSIRARDEGRPVVTYPEFIAGAPPLDRRRIARMHYRRAGESLVNGRWTAAAGNLATAFVHSPAYVVRRLVQQRRSHG